MQDLMPRWACLHGGWGRAGRLLAVNSYLVQNLLPQSLLGIPPELADRYQELLVEDRRLDRVHLRRQGEYSERELLRCVAEPSTRGSLYLPTTTPPTPTPTPSPRPGVSRLSFAYFMSDEVVEYIIKAVTMVAEHGWKLLPLVSGLCVDMCTAYWTRPLPHTTHSV